MKKQHVIYAAAAALIIGGGTMTAIKLTSDNTAVIETAVESTDEGTTENGVLDAEQTDSQASVGTKDDRTDDKKDDKKDDASSTAENAGISSNITDGSGISSGSNSSESGNSSGNGSSGDGNSSVGNGGSQGNGSQGNGNDSTEGNGGSSGGGSSASTEAPAPTHTHNWTPVYKTVHHDEVSHTERVEIKPAEDVPVYGYGYVCGKCGCEITVERWRTLQIAYCDDGTEGGIIVRIAEPYLNLMAFLVVLSKLAQNTMTQYMKTRKLLIRKQKTSRLLTTINAVVGKLKNKQSIRRRIFI
ncbi:MAG: hypothetical protein NC393_07915 [Clostridium sp.]|nr:hypothetical protein [Clostridium sp.]MCM1172039.1 hypothetical protein [Clostridium sp.]MCM1209041.1 hypothetical protein [Ruminococcus sp.]